MKWGTICKNLPVNVIFRLLYPWRGDSQFLAASAGNQNCNYVRECSNHHPSLSTLSLKGFNCSKTKWRAIYTTLPVNIIVRLPHSWRKDIQSQEIFLAHSSGKQTHNYDTDFSNHHSSLSPLRPKGFSKKWWAIYTNLPVNVIIRLPLSSERRSTGPGNIFRNLCWQGKPKLWHRVIKPLSLHSIPKTKGV